MATVTSDRSTIRVRRPTADFGEAPAAPTHSVGRPLPGLTVGLRTDKAWRSWQLIAEVWGERLRRDGARTREVEAGGQVGTVGSTDHARMQALAEECDAVIVGLGTCGSCTSFTIRDAVTAEEAGKPVVALVTEEFETHGRNMARFLGHGDLRVLVLPYPLEARSEEELRAIAAEHYPRALELLGVTA